MRIKDNEKKAADVTRLPPLEQKVTRHAPSGKDTATVKKAEQLQLQKIQYNIRQSPKFGGMHAFLRPANEVSGR